MFIKCALLLCCCVVFSQVSNTDEKLSPQAIEKVLSAKEQQELKKSFTQFTDNDLETAMRLLVLDFAPYVKTLSRDITTYNYRKKDLMKIPDGKIINSDSALGIDYANEWAEAITTYMKHETGYLGWGLYTSSNIRSSEGYSFKGGFSNFALVTVKYNNQEKMLDIRKHKDQMPISTETLSFLQKRCSSIEKLKVDKTISKKDLTRDEFCHDAFVRAMKFLEVKGIIYEWSGSSSNYCEQETNAAFLAFDKVLDEKSVDVFTNLFPQKDRKDFIVEPRFEKPVKPKKRSNKELYLQKMKEYQDKLKDYQTKNSKKDLEYYEKALKLKSDYKKIKFYIETYGYPDDVNKFTKIAASSKMFRSKISDSTGYEAYVPQVSKKFHKVSKKIERETFGCSSQYKEEDRVHYEPSQVWEYILKFGLSGLNLSDDMINKIEKCKM